MKRHAPFLAVLLLLVACATPAILTPPTGAGTDWACKPTEHECATRACCLDGYDCGGGPFNGCPAGSCCAAPDEGYAARRPLAQTPRSVPPTTSKGKTP